MDPDVIEQPVRQKRRPLQNIQRVVVDLHFNFAEFGEQIVVLLKVTFDVWVLDIPHQQFFILQMFPRVLVHHHFTVLQTFPVSGFKKAVDSSKPNLMLRINCSIPDLVAVFPFDGHGTELSAQRVVGGNIQNEAV